MLISLGLVAAIGVIVCVMIMATGEPATFVERGAAELAVHLKQFCRSTLAPAENVPGTGPILVVWADSGEVVTDIQQLLPESSQPKSEGDIVFVAGLRRSDSQESTYTDGAAGYRIDYEVTLFLYREAERVAESTLIGYPPPYKKSWGGPAYGDPPAENVAGWLAEQTGTRVIGALGAHLEPVTCLAFCTDSRALASGSKDGEIRLWDTAAGLRIAALSAYTDEVRDIAFARDGLTFASAGYDLRVKSWDITSGQLSNTIQVCSWGYGVNSLAYSPDGKTLATAGWVCGGVTLWDAAASMKLASLSDATSPAFVEFCPLGKFLAWDEYEEDGNSKKVVLWDLQTGEESQVFRVGEMGVSCADFSHDGTLLAIGGRRKVTVLNLTNSENVVTLPLNDWAYALAFSPDGRWLASGSKDVLAEGDMNGTVRVWDVDSWEQVTTMSYRKGINALAWHPQGEMLAFAGEDCLIRVWDVASGQLVEWS